jgi:hypothetical protein
MAFCRQRFDHSTSAKTRLGLLWLCFSCAMFFSISRGMGQTRPEGIGICSGMNPASQKVTASIDSSEAVEDPATQSDSRSDEKAANQELDASAVLPVLNTVVLWQETGPAIQEMPAAGKKPDSEALKINALTGIGNADPNNYSSLTGKERWHFYLNQNFTTPAALIAPMFSGLWDQAAGEPQEWGGGMKGYGRRVASRYGAGLVGGSVQSGMSAILGQEPRYIRSSESTVLGRMGHAFLYGFITYNNEGKRRFAIATLGSYYASSMTAIMWMPDRFTVLGDGVREGNRQVIFSGVVNQLQEFWPDIRRIVFRRH